MASTKFDRLIAKLPIIFKKLENQPLLDRDNLADIPKQGIYVFYDKHKPIYVGRSNRLKSRIQEHSRQGSGHNKAQLAFNMTKKKIAANREIPTYITRKELETAPGFNRLFFQEKINVGQMRIRVIEISNQTEQALFEIYAALMLDTTHNDFGTH